ALPGGALPRRAARRAGRRGGRGPERPDVRRRRAGPDARRTRARGSSAGRAVAGSGRGRSRPPGTSRGMKTLFVLDPLAGLSADIDASIGLMDACQAEGAEIWVCEPADLAVAGGRL